MQRFIQFVRRLRALPASWIAVQAILLGGGLAWAAMTVEQRQARTRLPPLRAAPMEVRPQYDRPEIVTDAQLQRVLRRLIPRFEGPPKINDVDHALRLWGPVATFRDRRALSGAAMRALLLDSHRFSERYGTNTPGMLVDAGLGVRTRVRQGPASTSHTDHTLAVQAEIGTPLDFPVTTATRLTTLRAMLEQSLSDFSLQQTEYEWSVLAYALFVAPSESQQVQWHTTEGQRITFDRLASRLLRQPAGHGVCYGNHRLHALVMLLRVDQQQPILSSEARTTIINYLRDTTSQLVAHQRPEGYVTGDWPAARVVVAGTQAVPPDSLSGRLLATGHVLEWWALAPPEILPPRETLVRAGQWLCRTIDELDERQLAENYTFLSHAGRGLALWRGTFPAEALNESSDRSNRE